MLEKLSLRQRNRLAVMRLVQAEAVTRFERDGFDATTIEEIADTTGVSASTIYRHFGTKEALVLWDDRDRMLDHELAARLGTEPTLLAFRDAAVAALAEREPGEREQFLRRLKLVYAEPDVWSAAAQQDRVDRTELAAAFAATSRRRKATLADEVKAATCLAALDVALERWQRAPRRSSLARLITQAIDELTTVADD